MKILCGNKDKFSCDLVALSYTLEWVRPIPSSSTAPCGSGLSSSYVECPGSKPIIIKRKSLCGGTDKYFRPSGPYLECPGLRPIIIKSKALHDDKSSSNLMSLV
ncbi:hypothetical protein CDAR_297011 [Caerostris darwini]|uniref:Uncharacterized protein n=1 Tax=Caerostris darwini TaxID=1538125 RepID=A0AAV4QCC3_9ARAC|nr:hypothetical protein CDAR_297011 [Caerostris darwini]